MSRARKLLLAGVVLALGIGLAWPFRKTGLPTSPGELQGTPPVATVDSLARTAAGQGAESTRSTAQRHTAAKMASTGDPVNRMNHKPGQFLSSNDLANHPALENHPKTEANPPQDLIALSEHAAAKQEKPTSRPAYATANESSSDEGKQNITLHIVCNTDTLEKLAKRYLGDEGRALELFDLNRDQLSNPHLLPIGAKLKIPVAPDRSID